MGKKIYIEKNVFFALLLMILILIETAFENTPLQNYSLTFGRICFALELIVFIIFLGFVGFTRKRLLHMLFLSLIFFSSYIILNSTLIFQMFIFSMAISTVGISKSFGIIFKFKLIVTFLIISLSLIGILPIFHMRIDKGIGTTYGYGLGFTHPNRLASSICYIILSYICWKKEEIYIKNSLIIFLVTILTYWVTKSRTIVITMFILFILYFFRKLKITNSISNWFIKIYSVISLPMNVLVSLIIPYFLLTSSGFLQSIVFKINLLFSRRFTHIEHILIAYPISLFGGQFDKKVMEIMFGYAVVDNGYITFLYRYGIIGLAIFCIFSIISVLKMCKNREYTWLSVFIVVAAQGLLEDIYSSIGLNLLVVFWACIFSKIRNENKGEIRNDSKENTFYMAWKK